MVYRTYNDIDEAYRRVRIAHAAGQVAQSVMILVAAEVRDKFDVHFHASPFLAAHMHCEVVGVIRL
jgi:hypothetical protein